MALPGRVLAAGLLALIAAGPVAAPASPDARDWRWYQSRFITAEGRVLDTANRSISHSEGQGYAMLLAIAHGDPVGFERLWRWTERHLQIRNDHLFAWKWDPAAPDGPVPDPNSAADGDLLIAWALTRAAALWEVPRYREEAGRIARDIRSQLVVWLAGRPVLLPAPTGFVHGEVLTLNPSYWLFPAFAELAEVDPSPEWQALADHGIALLRRARFGRFALPPDWLELAEWAAPSSRHPPLFGYNAVRVPLNLIWAGIDDVDLIQPFVELGRAYRGWPPATIDLESGAESAGRLSAGGRAILELARVALQGGPPDWPPLDRQDDYFSASLLLLTKIAYAERFRT